MQTSSRVKSLSIFSLVMITVGSVDSIRNLPATALFGSQLIFFFVLATLFFLLPCALVSAELASNFPENNGVYDWIKMAFGDRTGFIAIWLQWVENVIWYPTILAFVGGTLGYWISPHLAENKWFLVSVIVIAFWGATLVNLFGIKASAWFSTFCSIGGLFIPMGIIIALGAVWVFTGHPLQISFSSASLMPSLHDPEVWVSLTGIILSFCGMEITAVHARDVKNPKRDYPLALIYSVAIIVGTLLLGALAIAIVLPEKNISLVAGLMQAYDAFFTAYHLHWILPFVAIMLVIGGMGGVNNWIIAPVRGLLFAAEDGYLPPVCKTVNRFEAPKFLLILQAVLVSLLAGAFLLMPSVNASYWLLTALAAQLYMIMYVMMFIAGIRLQKKIRAPDYFYVPGGRYGLPVVAIMGIMGALVTFMVGFLPPAGINVGGRCHYEILLITSLLFMLIPPFLFYRYGKRHWQETV